MKDITIEPVNYALVSQFRSEANKEGVVMDPQTEYLGALRGGALVGFVGLMDMKSKSGLGHMRFKSDWIMPLFRGKGIYARLFAARLELLKERKFTGEVSAYCTQMSLPTYLKNGFLTQKVLQRGSTFVKLILTT